VKPLESAPEHSDATPLLEVEDIVKHFPAGGGIRSRRVVHALDGVTLTVYEGETLGIVGESGCGKTTLGRCLVRLYEPTAGTIRFRGQDITHLPERDFRRFRSEMQMVFQDPYSSLNPRKRVSAIVGDVLRAHGVRDRKQIEGEVQELLRRVGLRPEHARRHPREFSGGQRQRIGIARALVLRPRLIVADEPVSALDVSIQAQIVNLLADLQEEYGLTLVLIAHDLGLVRQVASRIGVMYLGKLVELAGGDDLYAQPIHPYTEALLSAVPIPDPVASARRKRIVLEGDLPSPIDPPAGCRFHTRCPYASVICRTTEPPLIHHGGGRHAACHHPLNVGSDGVRRAAEAAAPAAPAGGGTVARDLAVQAVGGRP
jgi:oligopeptide/dipeptide ABC transporter ATP-binding protein